MQTPIWPTRLKNLHFYGEGKGRFFQKVWCIFQISQKMCQKLTWKWDYQVISFPGKFFAHFLDLKNVSYFLKKATFSSRIVLVSKVGNLLLNASSHAKTDLEWDKLTKKCHHFLIRVRSSSIPLTKTLPNVFLVIFKYWVEYLKFLSIHNFSQISGDFDLRDIHNYLYKTYIASIHQYWYT